jgi:hypothetical protein
MKALSGQVEHVSSLLLLCPDRHRSMFIFQGDTDMSRMIWLLNLGSLYWQSLNGVFIMLILRGSHLINCSDITVYSDISEDPSETQLYLFGKHVDHCVGAMVWGLEATSGLLFASSEPHASDDHNLRGYHKAFDVTNQKTAYQFDADEAGDAMCIAPDGMFYNLPRFT